MGSFNTSILSLNHFKFRQLFQAKCAVKGNSPVVCSEMYTSRTCDVFTCPLCTYRADRDENAALNILRNVCAGSLQVFEWELHHLLPDFSVRLKRGRQQCREKSLKTDCSVQVQEQKPAPEKKADKQQQHQQTLKQIPKQEQKVSPAAKEAPTGGKAKKCGKN
jgi:hypothetical protein